MSGKKKLVAGVVLSTLLSYPAFAAKDTALSASDRAAALQTLAAQLKENYITPAVAERVGKAITRKNADGGYASTVSRQGFIAALSKDLREFSGDKHFRAMLDDSVPEASRAAATPRRSEEEEEREQAVREGFGIEKIDHLAGNVGYIELSGFRGPVDVLGPAYTSAISLLAGTDALIVDLRRNGGGSPVNVAYLMSHFFPLGDKRHLNDIYHRRSGNTRQFWTVATVTQRYTKPVYVLTAARTFSGGEECAYHFQAQKRGTVVGETTGGGANPVSRFSVGHGMTVAIPTGRAINPVTGTNWDGVGVKPDIAVPAEQALQTAHAAILRNLASSAKDGNARADLQRVLAMVEKGESEKPVYTMRKDR